ncbi:hypothetical protein B0T25DRAFT_492947 [Lasiosphaeria hispida]|uniref:F-box domain-containing protein n=1 Tax=Lasiosphaeria hispida TaxID=260671 RepID=A0AAJ0MKP3_9PEZI|nr:hypothetical protein B0T25DRAFT_492947 [Lasiosphaeria hispida]
MAEMDFSETAGKPFLGCIQATITSLPYEVLTYILRDNQLSQDDVKAVRLSCRKLSKASTALLFYRIGISKLRVDRHAFLSIAGSPHLAQNVREVEWLELSWDAHLTSRISSGAPCACQQVHVESDQDLVDLCHQLHAAAEAEFWLPTTPPRPGRRATAEFQHVFQAAVDNLHNLHTFISRPMSSRRTITRSGYPMEASLLQTFQEQPVLPEPPQTNDGLFLFLLPAMNRPASIVKRLRWADEFPGFSYLRPFPASSLERLESLDLCLTPSVAISEESLSGLAAALVRAAPSIRHLKLCTDHGVPEVSYTNLERMLLGPGLATADRCALRSLSIVSAGICEDSLILAIEANARSMRHLYIEGPPISSNFIHERNYRFLATAGQLEANEYDSDIDTDSEDSVYIRHRTGPRWAWGRFFHRGVIGGETFYFQVPPDASPAGHPTEYWKFTYRNGEVAYGDDPSTWFEDWDSDAGDLEEPTPFGEAIDDFDRNGGLGPPGLDTADLASYLGGTWDLLRGLEPPEGAVLYCSIDPATSGDYR